MDSYDAISLDLGYYRATKSGNCDFFFEIMKNINSERAGFLEEELPLVQGSDKLDNSLFYTHHFPQPVNSQNKD